MTIFSTKRQDKCIVRDLGEISARGEKNKKERICGKQCQCLLIFLGTSSHVEDCLGIPVSPHL